VHRVPKEFRVQLVHRVLVVQWESPVSLVLLVHRVLKAHREHREYREQQALKELQVQLVLLE
jgi:putative ribosome biogenesis GTPase RsgA